MGKFLQLLGLFFAVFIFSQAPVDIKIKDANGNESFNVSCNHNLDANGCLSLHVEYPVLRRTASYEVNSIPYAPPIPMDQGTSLNANYDDLFAVQLDLPLSSAFSIKILKPLL
ncbi:hypothetical protein QWZ06_26300 [Chryseobacterium tructae]|uniref:hypothetical protein n=1 Tax=Chryseobacterium tructae TaxID=1037380 RepID=UPI0025B30A34|nr:hypothetical protein [Chryseobacterium tructae]MDN3695490.1 hypothetical protein [Chryseobacterium tructae]